MRASQFPTLLGDDDGVDADLKPDRALVMIVDDDSILRNALRGLLEEFYRVVTFDSGPPAVEAISDEVAVVILDVKMKGHDGFWTCEAIRAKSPYLPVIFFSAYQNAKDPYEIINQHRPFGYLSKNGDAEALMNMVDRAAKYSSTFVRLMRFVGLQVFQEGMRNPKPDKD